MVNYICPTFRLLNLQNLINFHVSDICLIAIVIKSEFLNFVTIWPFIIDTDGKRALE